MRNPSGQRRARRALAALAVLAIAAAEAGGAELTLSGDIGIAQVAGDGRGRNDQLGRTDSGSGDDATPVYGAALGIALPLDEALPWRLRLPSRRFRDGVPLPDWIARFEIEHLRASDAELATTGVNAQQPYRADVESWSLMGKLRLDLPVRRPVEAIAGRLPFLDPLTLYLGAGVGIASSELDVSDSVLFGSESELGFAWQGLAGLGYRLNSRVHWSVGWRYRDFGSIATRLVAAAGVERGRYAIDLQAHEFTTSLTFAFWRLALVDVD